jgi:hypothetical protein
VCVAQTLQVVLQPATGGLTNAVASGTRTPYRQTAHVQQACDASPEITLIQVPEKSACSLGWVRGEAWPSVKLPQGRALRRP